MFKILLRRLILAVVVSLLQDPICQVCQADIIQQLGDSDFFGFGGGVVGIDSIPDIDTDNRTAADPAFTDHDVREVVFGNDSQNNIAWTHDFSGLLAPNSVAGAKIELALAGIQDGGPFPGLDDRIFIEGIEIAGALDTVDQGAFGTGMFEFELSATQLDSFKGDLLLDVFFDGGRVSSGSQAGAIESFYVDFSRVTVTSVPEPSSSILVAFAWLAFLHRRRI